jgi:hypothetical protein
VYALSPSLPQVSLTWTGTDSAGNSANVTQTIVVLPVPDIIPPVISVPGPLTILMGQLLIVPQVGLVTLTLLHLRSLNHERHTVMEVGLLCEATLLKSTTPLVQLIPLISPQVGLTYLQYTKQTPAEITMPIGTFTC